MSKYPSNEYALLPPSNDGASLENSGDLMRNRRIAQYRHEIDEMLKTARSEILSSTPKLSKSKDGKYQRELSSISPSSPVVVEDDLVLDESDEVLCGSNELIAKAKKSIKKHAASEIVKVIAFGVAVAFLLIAIRAFFIRSEANSSSFRVLNVLFDELSARAGRVQCQTELDPDSKLMSTHELKLFLSGKRTHLGGRNIEHVIESLLAAIIHNPRWHIFVLDAEKNPVNKLNENGIDNHTYFLFTDLAFRPFACRIKIALYRIGRQLLIATSVIAIAALIYRLVQYRKQFQKEVLDVVNKVCLLLIEQKKRSCSDPAKAIVPYIAVNHLRDYVVPLDCRSTRRNYKYRMWTSAQRFIRQCESRIREEYQLVDGEEHLVWRWIGSLC